jgi:F-box/leucine-rich repeat protein 2/20
MAAHSKRLRDLRVSWCRGVTDVGVMAVAEGCPALQTLHVAGCLITDVSVASLNMMLEVNVSRCRLVRDGGIAALARCSAFLCSLDIGACGSVGDAGLVQVAAHCKGLRHLNSSLSPGVGNRGIVAVAQSCRQLALLNVSGSLPLSCVPTRLCTHAYCFIRCGDACSVLRFLGVALTGCDVNDEGLQAIAASATALRDINVSYCKAITAVGVNALLTIDTLQVLNVFKCDGVVIADVDHYSRQVAVSVVTASA